MKKLRKSLFIGLSVFALLLVIAALVFYVRFSRATRSMTPAETGAVNDTVWCIRDKFVNAFIFRGDSGYVMFDAGFSKRNFAKEMEKTGIDPLEIRAIFLTHTDGDHIGAMALFPHAKVYMHRDEEQMVNGTLGKTKFHKTLWKYQPYDLLNSNDSLMSLGLKIRIIHTPGHTPGSACFTVNGDYLITGDNLVVKGGKYEQFLDMFNMDTPRQIGSIKILPDPANFRYILTGHYGIVKMQ
jgi:hydroxyacylglutathione hydrolase